MNDQELRKLLLETCPVRPGQESCAWSALRERLYNSKPQHSGWSWLYYPAWRGLALVVVALVLIPIAGNFILTSMEHVALATAYSKSPGIYATAFYSHSAKAQVIWLNGMEPATDKPTYLDPTTVLTAEREAPQPAHDPNSL